MDMVSKKDYAQALEIIREYEGERNKRHISSFTCVNCKENEVKPGNDINTEPLKQEQGYWIGGTVDKVSFGFGSIHDLENYYVAICDACVSELEEAGLLKSLRKLGTKIRKEERS